MLKSNFFLKRISYLGEEKKPTEVILDLSLFNEATHYTLNQMNSEEIPLIGNLVYLSIDKQGMVSYGEIKEGMFYPFLIDISCCHLGQPKGEYSISDMVKKLQREKRQLIVFSKEGEIYSPKYLFKEK